MPHARVVEGQGFEGQTPGPGQTDLTSFPDALVGLQSALLFFLPFSPSHWPGQVLMAATSLLLRDGRGCSGDEHRLLSRQLSSNPDSAIWPSALVIYCCTSKFVTTVTVGNYKEFVSGMAGQFCHRVPYEVPINMLAKARVI